MKILKNIGKIVFVLSLVYLFLLGIQLVSSGAKFLGKDFARHLITTTSNPFVGLFIGIIVTALVQSSSMTTSLVVALVGSGTLGLTSAIPIVMGANVGTTITNMLVSFGCISWRQEFKRAFAAATVHDIFNILTLIVLFPLELKFRYLTNLAMFLKKAFEGVGGIEFTSPARIALAPLISFLKHFLTEILPFSHKVGGILLIAVGLVCLFVALSFLMKVLKKMFIGKAEILIDKYIFKNGLVAMGVGCLLTTIVQSSSLTTSIMVPLAGAGVVSLNRVLPYTLGANVGTTFTAFLASLAITGDMRAAALAVALAHLLFNLSGIAIFYPVKQMRQIPITLSNLCAEQCSKRRYLSVILVVTIFILIPALVIIFRNSIWR